MTAFRREQRDTVALTGIGYAPFSRASGRTVLSLAMEAGLAALRDAGLGPRQLGGIIEYQQGDSVKAEELAVALGAPPDGWYTDAFGGGHLACVVFAQAAMVIQAGMADHVLIFRALNGRSGYRLGDHTRGRQSGSFRFLAAAGLETTPAVFALLCQRHMHEFGTTVQQLASVAVTQREHALKNPRAVMTTPLTREDHFAARPIALPFRLFDCCQETDGACAVVMSRADIARDMPKPTVYVRSVAFSGGEGAQGTFDRWPDFAKTSSHFVGPELWSSAGVGPTEISFAELYDSFTWTVLSALEGFGFCPHGEGGRHVEENGIGLGSRLPVNTAGGLLSEGYIHGLNLAAAAIEQLRGEAGPRQVKDAEVALVTATGGVTRGSAMVLRR